MLYLLDTNVVSEPRRKAPDQRVLAWLAATDGEDAAISVVTVGEVEQGIGRAEGGRAAVYRAWLEDELLVAFRFRGRVLPLSEGVLRDWGRATGAATRAGRPVTLMDSLLAATAIHHGLTLVTRNAKDVAALGVGVLNPWDG